ncbi:hypothetical protein KSP39_PZI023682 [Platanthera zijinensis]|uniref:MAR-binding filament-like protein 1-1 n=1 Tax=Platanthera zijinensis TaxID=2320716 RepID=A0AAP0ASR1_9ASPA
MKTKVKNQEIAATLLKDSFEARLSSEHEEHQRQLGRLKNEEASLSSQLKSAKDAVVAFGREMQDEKKLVEELIAQRWQLECSFTQSMEDKKSLEAVLNEEVDKVTNLEDKLSILSLEIKEKEKNAQNLKSLLSECGSECNNLSSIIEQVREELAAANSSIEQLKEDNFKARDESSLKGSIIDDLHAKIKSLSEEKDDSTRKFYDIMKDYDELISYSESSAILNSELQAKKDEQLRQLEENFKVASSEISCNRTTIFELTRERDNLNDFLEKEKDEINRLTNELQSVRELLSSSRAEISHISKELVETKSGYEEAMSKILKMQKYYDQEIQSLNTNLEDAKATLKIISDELESANADRRSTEDSLVSASVELKTVIEERESLKKELVDTYKRLETTANQLKEERKIVSHLNKELDDLHKQILKDSQSQKSLEADLDEATRSLDEMNRSALLLSRELENTNSRSSSLEVEKEILYKSLIEQKTLTKEAHENIDDAKNFITKLGSERERLEKRSKRFEGELAAAKGEILRLRRNIRSGQESMTEIHPESIEVPAGTPFSVKKNPARRKKRSPGTDNS